MAERKTARGQRDDESSRDRDEREADGAESSTAGTTSTAEDDGESPENFDDFGRALQEQIAEALEPAIAEFRQQVEEAVRVQGDQPEKSDGGRETETRPASQSSQEEEQPVAQAPTRETERRADAPRRREDNGRSERGREDDERSERARDDGGRGERRQGLEGRQLARASRPQAPRREERGDDGSPRRLAPRQVFEGRSAARVGWLRLARKWRDAGAQYQAIHAYTEILVRYPGEGVSNAAAEELLELAEQLEDQGRFYSALNIMERLERLL